MDENVVLLNEDDLDGIVGGAFNHQAAQNMGLAIQEKNGVNYVVGTLERSSGKFPNIIYQKTSGSISERALRSSLKESKANFTFTNAAGESVTLGKKQIAKILA
ncbi:hypothetical protein LJC46_08005 [Desulfovibrio sp. OttesenSCG-928-G15]|nr:hypothetical protein [Desulfovibrio sp. OttesenSCG-928-G15]